MPPILQVDKAKLFLEHGKEVRDEILLEIVDDLQSVYQDLDNYVCKIHKTLRAIRTNIPKEKH